MSRNYREIADELATLNQLKTNVPNLSAFGDDNEAAIRAQIEVIEERLTLSQIQDRFDQEPDYTLSATLDAGRWLYEDDDPPSESWNMIVLEFPAESPAEAQDLAPFIPALQPATQSFAAAT